MDLRLRQLRHFVAFAETPDFRVLAQRLGVPRSTLIFQIRALEEAFGSPLIDQSCQRTRLTPSGEILLETARRVLHKLDVVQQRIANPRASRNVSICCSQAGQNLVLVELLRYLDEHHPSLEVELKILIPDERIQSLIAGDVDLLVMVPPTRAPGVEFHHLRSERLYALLPENYPLKNGSNTISVHEFADLPLLLPREHECRFAREFALSVLQQFNLHPKVVDVTTSRNTTLAMIAAGRGVVLTSSSMRGSEEFGVRKVAFRESLPPLPLGIAWRSDDRSPTLASMRNAVIAVAQRGAPTPLEGFPLYATLPTSAAQRLTPGFHCGASTLSRNHNSNNAMLRIV